MNGICLAVYILFITKSHQAYTVCMRSNLNFLGRTIGYKTRSIYTWPMVGLPYLSHNLCQEHVVRGEMWRTFSLVSRVRGSIRRKKNVSDVTNTSPLSTRTLLLALSVTEDMSWGNNREKLIFFRLLPVLWNIFHAFRLRRLYPW